MSVLRAIFWKDLATEWRRRDRVIAMGMFSVIVLVIFQFAVPPGTSPAERAHLPGLLWVAHVFAAVLGLSRAFADELEDEALSALALAPADRGLLYLGKALAAWVLVFGVQLLTTALFGIAFDLALGPIWLPLGAVLALGALGLCSVGTLFAAMTARTGHREVLLPLLLLPLQVPVVLGAVLCTEQLLRDATLPSGALQLLLVTDGVFLIVSFLGFEYVLDE